VWNQQKRRKKLLAGIGSRTSIAMNELTKIFSCEKIRQKGGQCQIDFLFADWGKLIEQIERIIVQRIETTQQIQMAICPKFSPKSFPRIEEARQ